MRNGNSFDQESTVKVGHARKVWREIREVYPAGGTCSNVSDWVSEKLIPSGTPVVFEASANTFKALKAADVKADAGINGVLQEDVVITNASTVATGTIVCDGDIYGFMLGDAVAGVLKALPSVNGYKVRVV